MKIGIPMLLKGLNMIASHASEVSEKPSKMVSNVFSTSTAVGSAVGAAALFGGEEVHALIGAWDGASTEQLVAHVVVYVAQAVMGIVGIWAVGKKPGTKIDD